MTIQEALKYGQNRLSKNNVPNPALDAQVLLSHALSISREGLYLNNDRPLSKEDMSAYEILLVKRCRRIPVAYITGKKEFFGVEFMVTPNVLIPRPETEFAVEKALDALQGEKDPLVADLCCGSGVIGISIALNHPDAKVFASDISEAAGKVTTENAKVYGLEDRIVFLQGNIWGPFDKKGLHDFDLVVSNPPYIPSNVIPGLSPEIAHEPAQALDGGEEGTDFYKAIIGDLPRHLKPGGGIILEIGHDQAGYVKDMLHEAGFSDIDVIKDLAGFDRVIAAKLFRF